MANNNHFHNDNENSITMEKQNQPSLSFLSHQKGWIVLVLIFLVATQFVE